MDTFTQLGLSAAALDNLQRAGFEKPTPIQAKAIPPALEGRDVIGCAATGTGKTAAFSLPLLDRLAANKLHNVLVLAPTRELALQISEQVERFGGGRGIRCAVLIGGVGMGGQISELQRKPQIIVATPGRLLDHMERGTARVDGIDALVLDEADRMLDMGFKPQLTRILNKLPRKRQTMLFSATMAGEVADFARASLHDPVRVEVARSGTTASRAVQRVFHVGQNEKTALLVTLLKEDSDTTLVFTRTKRRADNVARSVEKAGETVARLHANRSQNQREAALDGFRDGRYRVLVATDIAARGIDVEQIGHVVIYDLPHVAADYVHRVGRTARAAASGRASTFMSPEEAPLLRDIEKLTRAPLPKADVPRDNPVFKQVMSTRQEKVPQFQDPRRKQHHGHKPKHGGGGGGGGGGHKGQQQKRHGHGGGGGGGHAHGGGGGGGGHASSGSTVFSGGPRRRR